MDTYIGFDSAWTDNPRNPGAICALTVENNRGVAFYPPRLACFDEALKLVETVRTRSGVTLVALDQPTIVPNLQGMRPVERAAASLVSWLGGGVQPANRSKIGMFCNDSPIWKFLKALDAIEDPEKARRASGGLYLMEVFPALALASFDPNFFGRKCAPKYNPANRKKFRQLDWERVALAAARDAEQYGFEEIVDWAEKAAEAPKPRKADQDMLDSLLCLLIALRWRLRPRIESVVLGNLETGYMVLPVSASVRERLALAAQQLSIPLLS